MNRWIVVCVMLMAVSQFAEAAPALKTKEIYYFPTKVGDKLVYETQGAETVPEDTDEVTKVEVKDGRVQVSMKRETAGKTTSFSTAEVSDKGVMRISVGGKDLPAAVHLLKLPAKVGDSWEDGPNAKFTVVKDNEEVDVPAGKFRAIRIEWDRNPIGQGTSRTIRFAPFMRQIGESETSDRQQLSELLGSSTCHSLFPYYCRCKGWRVDFSTSSSE